MQNAIDVSMSIGDAMMLRGVVTDVRRYYNEEVVATPFGTSNATGHFAFFMLMLGNHFFGFCVATLILATLFYVCLRLDRRICKMRSSRDIVLGITFVLMLLHFLVDGNYDSISGYLQLTFCLLIVRYFLPYLLVQNGPKWPQYNAKKRAKVALTPPGSRRIRYYAKSRWSYQRRYY